MSKRWFVLALVAAGCLAYPQTSPPAALPLDKTVSGLVGASDVARYKIQVSMRSLVYLATDVLRGQLRFVVKDSAGKSHREVNPSTSAIGVFRLAEVLEPG